MHDEGPVTAPAPGSAEELAAFAELQEGLPKQFTEVFPDPTTPRTVVVVPSLSVDEEILSAVAGAPFYEERLLCLLMLLRMPRTKVIYLTSVPVHETIVDYYLHLLAGVPSRHARQRLVLLSCHDDSSRSLVTKLLERPRLLRRIRDHIDDPASTHITCYVSSDEERSLAVQLGVPLYGCDPTLTHLGHKSDGREVMRAAGVRVPEGYEHLRDVDDLAGALAELKARNPDLRRAVAKVDAGFSGEGNALFSYDGAPSGGDLQRWVRRELPNRIDCVAAADTWESYAAKYDEMGGIAEEFIEGVEKRSPNARYRIDPLGRVNVVSTQDQILGGNAGQVYLACRFPAEEGYRTRVQELGHRIATELRDRGVIGPVGPDFLCVRRGDDWDVYGLEINIRKGGATHPFSMLEFLTDGSYDLDTGTYRTPSGEMRCYLASDNVTKPQYVGMTPDDLIDIAVDNGIHFHGATQQGTAFHLIGALSRFGKLGLLSIDRTPEAARRRYYDTISVLDAETSR